MTSPTSEVLQQVKRWVKIPDSTKVRFREEGREGIIDGLTELVVGPGRNPDSRTQYRVSVGIHDRALAIEECLLVLNDQEGVVHTVRPKGEYRRVITLQLRAVLVADRFVTTAYDGSERCDARGARSRRSY